MNSYSFVQIILYVLASSLAVIAIFNKSPNPRTNKILNLSTVIFIILSLGFSIVFEVLKADDDRQKSESKEIEHKQYIDSLTKIIEKSDIILYKSDSTLKTQLFIQKKTDSILGFSNEISEETQNVLNHTTSVIKGQQEALNQITGGNSFCVLETRIIPSLNESSVMFILRNIGDYPLQNIYISIDNPMRSRLLPQTNTDHLYIPDFSFKIDYLAEKENMYLGDFIYPNALLKPNIVLVAHISFRKGYYIQLIKLAEIKPKIYRSATRIEKHSRTPFNYEEVDKLYPRNSKGEVDWKILEQ